MKFIGHLSKNIYTKVIITTTNHVTESDLEWRHLHKKSSYGVDVSK